MHISTEQQATIYYSYCAQHNHLMRRWLSTCSSCDLHLCSSDVKAEEEQDTSFASPTQMITCAIMSIIVSRDPSLIYSCMATTLDTLIVQQSRHLHCRSYTSTYQEQPGGARGRGRGRQPVTSSPARAAPSPDRGSPAYGRGQGRGIPLRRGG